VDSLALHRNTTVRATDTLRVELPQGSLAVTLTTGTVAVVAHAAAAAAAAAAAVSRNPDIDKRLSEVPEASCTSRHSQQSEVVVCAHTLSAMNVRL